MRNPFRVRYTSDFDETLERFSSRFERTSIEVVRGKYPEVILRFSKDKDGVEVSGKKEFETMAELMGFMEAYKGI